MQTGYNINVITRRYTCLLNPFTIVVRLGYKNKNERLFSFREYYPFISIYLHTYIIIIVGQINCYKH